MTMLAVFGPQVKRFESSISDLPATVISWPVPFRRESRATLVPCAGPE
jgi:hypothetical protein